jgi:hypothetical protein
LSELALAPGDAQRGPTVPLPPVPIRRWPGRQRAWEVRTDRVAIHGTKRAGRERIVPRLGTPALPSSEYKAAYHALVTVRQKLTKDHPLLAGLVVYDARRTFAHWLELAKIPRSRRMAYLGHSVRDVTDRYEQHSVEFYLTADRKALRHVVGAQRLAFPVALEMVG